MKNPEQTTTHDSLAPVVLGSPAVFPGAEAGPIEALVARLAEEMVHAWHRGERVAVESLLDRHPELWNSPSAVLDLLYEEICLRHEIGVPPDREDLLRRFPAWSGQIDVLLNCAHALEAGVLGGFPTAGEKLGDFLLLEELGRGAQGRVFLATQSSLGDRPVVLKITTRTGQEHLSLARLQHTHIVPLLSVLEIPERDLRILCMPYFGGMTLAAILARMRDRAVEHRTGRLILEILEEARAAAAIALPPGRDPATPFLSRASHVEAVSWIGACLAEALKYAHERGLVHLDLKPSNVLLTADRQPMLLDFHLAQEPLAPGAAGSHFGGTSPYMSPEQKEAMAALKKGDTVPQAIDGRSDIYSFGLVLYEALGGMVADHSTQRLAAWQKANRHVPVGLADIIGRCLATEANNRYQNAAALAADLWNHLNDMPLKGVANRNLVERWSKWRRRKPHLLTLYGMLAAVLLTAGAALAFALIHVSHRVNEAGQALADGQKYLKNLQYKEAAATLQRGLADLEKFPGNRALKDQLTANLSLATRAGLAEELHQIADRFRFTYGLGSHSSARLGALQGHCRVFWDKRRLILDRLGKELAPEMEQRAQLDLLDLAILGANLHVSLARADEIAAARQQALLILDEAEASFGPNAVLHYERQIHAQALGEVDVAAHAERDARQCQPQTAWESYALGRSLLDAGNLEGAAVHFDRAATIDPNGLWPNFYQGICSYRLGHFEEAALAFTVCTTLAPTTPGCFFNRGLALAALKRPERALRDFDRALQLDPQFAEAALQRGILHFHEQRPAEAARDLRHALSWGAISPEATRLLQSLENPR